jgi:hypothetical protein
MAPTRYQDSVPVAPLIEREHKGHRYKKESHADAL